MTQLITYDIELLEPVLVTSVDGDPNSSVAYDFIPGSVLRGAMIGRFHKAGNTIDLSADTVRQLFFSAQTQFLNGYLLSQGTTVERNRPLPNSWRRVRGENAVYDLTFGNFPKEKKPERVPGFGRLTGDVAAQAVVPTPVEKRISIHIQRDREMGRSTRGSGEIYNYEALAPGQIFRAYILTTLNAEAVKPLVDLLAGELHLGGSRSAGYGRVRLQLRDDGPTVDEWVSARLQKSVQGKMVITLLSDLLLRDGRGNWTTDLQQLADKLGVTLLTAFPAARPIGGFNRKWGLPLPQRMAFQMGSVLVCEPPTDAQWTQLETYVRNGVGESREDGFGRIAVNWHTQSNYTIHEPVSPDTAAVPLPEDSDSRVVAAEMVERLWRSRLDTAVVARANQLATKQRISKSQLYRLRLKIQFAIRQVQQSPGELDDIRQDIKEYLKDLESRRTPREQFSKAWIEDEKLLQWIETLVDRTKKDTAGAAPFSGVTAKIGENVAAKWTDALALEYNLRLIDKVLAGIAKKSMEVA